MMTAAIMTATSSTMPTAVMTESRLKMMSSSMICAMTLQNEVTLPASRTWSSPSMRPWISQVALASRKKPPTMRMRSRPGELVLEEREQRLGQGHHPADAQQQQDAHAHGREDAHAAGAVALILGQLVGEDGDEDDVVDAEHDLERGQRQQRDPDLGVRQQFHGAR